MLHLHLVLVLVFVLLLLLLLVLVLVLVLVLRASDDVLHSLLHLPALNPPPQVSPLLKAIMPLIDHRDEQGQGGR